MQKVEYVQAIANGQPNCRWRGCLVTAARRVISGTGHETTQAKPQTSPVKNVDAAQAGDQMISIASP
jgi:hypothetical protein